MEKPKRLDTIDVEKIITICQDYIDFVDSDDFHEDNDYHHYISETAIKAVFGPDVWKFINDKMQ
jgi:hypothetical protein